MLQFIALFMPALIALGIYHHLLPKPVATRTLIFGYGIFTIFINLCLYMIYRYLLGQSDAINFDDSTFIRYTLLAVVFAFILPFVVRMVEASISIEVKKHDKK